MSGQALRGWRNTGLVLLAIVIAWQGLYWIVGDLALRSPLQTVAYAAQLLSAADFWEHFGDSAYAFCVSLLIAVTIGLAIGFALGFHRPSALVFEPMLLSVYAIPKIALYPIILLSFGLGMPAKIAFGTLYGIVPTAIFTINAVRNVRPVLIKSARVMRLRWFDMVRLVLFPAAVPEIFSGFRLAFSLTLVGTLLGEMFAAQSGLGYLLMRAIGLQNVDRIMALILLMFSIAGVMSAILLAIDRRLHWRA